MSAPAPRPGLFPLVVLAPAAAVALLMWLSIPPALAMTIAVLTLIGGLMVAEHRWPFSSAWRTRADHETWTDLMYIGFASVPDRLTRVAVEAFLVLAVGAAAGGSEPVTLASAGAAAIAFLVSDLGKYLIHRASHQNPWLWRFHLAHHQPTRLSASNALRLHPINMAYNAAIDMVPVVLLGVPPQLAALLATLRATVGVVQHTNLHLESGRQWLVNAPSLHRTHHDLEPSEGNHNFASTLLVWDRLFGTLRHAPPPARVGVPAMDHRLPTSFIGQLLYPWCRERLHTSCVMARFRSLR